MFRESITWLVNQIFVKPPLLVNCDVASSFSHGISDDVFANAEQVGFDAAYQVLQLPTPYVIVKRQYSYLINILTVVFGAPVFFPDPMQKLVTVFLVDHGLTCRASVSDFPLHVYYGLP